MVKNGLSYRSQRDKTNIKRQRAEAKKSARFNLILQQWINRSKIGEEKKMEIMNNGFTLVEINSLQGDSVRDSVANSNFGYIFQSKNNTESECTGRSMASIDPSDRASTRVIKDLKEGIEKTIGFGVELSSLCYLCSDANLAAQHPHRDAHVDDLGTTPFLLGIFALEEGTALIVEKSFKSKRKRQNIRIEIPPNNVAIFHPLLVHAGADYKKENVRIHFISAENPQFNGEFVETRTNFVSERKAPNP